MTVSNTLPIPHNNSPNDDIQNAIINDDIEVPFEYETLHHDKSLTTTTHDDLTAIVTTPSSITEQPLISSENQQKPTKKWFQQLKVPFVMLFISLIQFLLYICFTFIYSKDIQHFALDPQKQHQAWRFLTYMIIHKDLKHLLQNVLLQCLFGVYLETYENRLKVFLVYIGGGIGGALGAATVNSVVVIGASGGVYALLMSYVAFIIFNYKSMKHRKYLIISVTLLVISDITYCVLHYTYNVSPMISNSAHLFGALFGLLIGLILFRNHDKHCDMKYYRISFVAAILLFFVIVILVVVDVKHLQSEKKVLVTKNIDLEYSAE